MKRNLLLLIFPLLVSMLFGACNGTSLRPKPSVNSSIVASPDKPTPLRCGDGICDGPENNANCPADCFQSSTAVPSIPTSTVQPITTASPINLPVVEGGDQSDTYRVTNPTTGARLYVKILHPAGWTDGGLPAWVLVPGGIGSGSDLTRPKDAAPALAQAGYTVVIFDPDGRGQSEGVENYDGFAQQDGLAAVIRFAATLPEVDAARLGAISFSYGVTMASGALARNPDLPVRYYIDWEGPADRNYTTSGCGPTQRIQWQPCTDNPWWSEREAVNFIGKLRIPYQRIQSEQDHVQPDNRHAVDMINAAVNGDVPWVRLNDLQPVQTYDPNNPPAMLPEEESQSQAELAVRFAREILALHPGG